MAHLVDTNVLLRIRHPSAPEYSDIRRALRLLVSHGEQLYVASQNMVEFWNVCTRPAASRGGLGLTVAETDRRARLIERLCILLPDAPAVHEEWRLLVRNHGVTGVQVHDSRFAAAMRVYGLPRFLTLNPTDFMRCSSITPVHPQHV